MKPALWVIVIWFMSTYWLLGDIDKHPKEYEWSERDPVSGTILPEYPWHMAALLQDARTIHRCFCMVYLGLCDTLLLNHMPLRVLMEALLQALVCWSLYRLLRHLRLSVPASAAASLLFLSCPVAVLLAGLGHIMMSTYLFLMMTCIYIGAFRVRHSLLMMILLAAAGTCFYEIEAPTYIALPLLYAAVHPDWAVPRQRKRMLVPVFCMLTVFVLYASIHVATREPYSRGGRDAFTPLSSVGTKAVEVAQHAVSYFYMNGVLEDAVLEGCRRFAEGHWMAWGAVCLAAACLWLSWWNQQTGTFQHGERRPLYLVIAFGLLAAILPWSLAVAVVMPSWSSRICYYPLAGALTAAAAAMDLVGSCLADHRSIARMYWRTMGALVLVATLFGAFAMIGTQSWYQIRGKSNKDFAVWMRALVPHPPPQAYFVPISLCPPPADAAARARLARVNSICPPMWGDSVAATIMLNFSYHRRDIGCWQIRGQTFETLDRWPDKEWNNGEVFEEADAHLFRIPVQHTNYQEHEIHAWKNVIPFTMDCAMNLRLIGTIHLEHPDNTDEIIDLPWVAAAASHPNLVGQVALEAPRPGQAPFNHVLWKWAGRKHPVPWEHLYEEAVRRNLVWLSTKHLAIDTLLLPCSRPIHVYSRILFKTGSTATLEAYLSASRQATDSIQLACSPRRGTGANDWRLVEIEVPPHSTPQFLTLRVTPDLPDDRHCALTEPLLLDPMQ